VRGSAARDYICTQSPNASRYIFDAGQFSKSSGYNEDAATGIAASAFSFALLENGVVGENASITLRQGHAMGAPSKIGVRFRKSDDGTM
jgi:predicted PhzF superfamily epimerase YddE/YHI9